MKNADMPAMPVMDGDNEPANLSHSYYQNLQLATGLTKREMFAIHAMQAIISAPSDKFNPRSASVAAQYAIELAEAMLEELGRTSK